MGARMDDKMPCGAPTGVFCLCHTNKSRPNGLSELGIPVAQPWVPLSKRIPCEVLLAKEN